jgi:hypothetical protein
MSDSTVDVTEQSGTESESKQEQTQTFTLEDVKLLRDEAARYRTRLRETEKARDEALSKLETVSGQVTELTTKLAPTEALALKYSVALDLGLPKVLAGRLTGNTEEELKADAESLKALLGNPAPSTGPDLEQGTRLSINSKPSVSDAFRAIWQES